MMAVRTTNCNLKILRRIGTVGEGRQASTCRRTMLKISGHKRCTQAVTRNVISEGRYTKYSRNMLVD